MGHVVFSEPNPHGWAGEAAAPPFLNSAPGSFQKFFYPGTLGKKKYKFEFYSRGLLRCFFGQQQSVGIWQSSRGALFCSRVHQLWLELGEPPRCPIAARPAEPSQVGSKHCWAPDLPAPAGLIVEQSLSPFLLRICKIVAQSPLPPGARAGAGMKGKVSGNAPHTNQGAGSGGDG